VDQLSAHCVDDASANHYVGALACSDRSGRCSSICQREERFLSRGPRNASVRIRGTAEQLPSLSAWDDGEPATAVFGDSSRRRALYYGHRRGGRSRNWVGGAALEGTYEFQKDEKPHLAKVRVAGSNPVFLHRSRSGQVRAVLQPPSSLRRGRSTVLVEGERRDRKRRGWALLRVTRRLASECCCHALRWFLRRACTEFEIGHCREARCIDMHADGWTRSQVTISWTWARSKVTDAEKS
jgi:hypothetical protein